MQERIVADVEKFGWHVLLVLGDEVSPGFAYSIGLQRTFGHPEIIIFGLRHSVAHAVINQIGELVRAGTVLAAGEQRAEILQGYDVAFRMVDPTWYEAYLGQAIDFYGGYNFPVLQALWPDRAGHLPWEAGFDPDLTEAQPQLAAPVHLGPNPTEAEMLGFVERWIDLLAEGRFVTAFHATAHDQYFRWSPRLIRQVIEGYGLPEAHPSGVRFQVTPREGARGGPPTFEVVLYEEAQPPFWEVIHDLPLNGEWSDLTATFRIYAYNGASTVVLQEIHVF